MSLFAQQLRKQARRASLEGDKMPVDGMVEVPADEDGVPTDTAETADAQVAETQTLQEAADGAVGEVEQSAEAVEVLDDVAESIERAMRDGVYLDKYSAGHVHAAIEAAVRKLGGRSDQVIASCESITSSNARTVTTAALEGIRDTAKSFWAWIKEQVAKAWAFVKNWYLKTLDTATRLKKKAEAVKKRAEDTSGSIGSDNKKFEAGLNSALHLNKKAPKPAEVLTHIGYMKDAASNLAGKTSEGFNEFTEALGEVAEDPADDKINALKGKLPTSLTGTTSGSANVADAIKNKYATVAQGTLTFGGQVLVFATGAGTKAANGNNVTAGTDTISAMKFQYGYEADAKIKDVEGKAEFDTIPASQVVDICDGIIEALDDVIKYKKTWEARGKTSNSLKTAFDKAEKSYDKADNTDGKAATATDPKVDSSKDKAKKVKEAAKGALAAWNAQTRGDASIISFVVSKSNSVLNLCSMSLSKHSGD